MEARAPAWYLNCCHALMLKYARQYRKEKFHFLSIASASLAEVGYGLHAARRLGYLAPAHYDALDLQVRQVAAPLNGLMDRFRSADPVEGLPSK